MHGRIAGVRRVPKVAAVRRGIIIVEVNKNRMAREYDNDEANYTDHPIIIKNGKSFFTNNQGETIYL